MKLAQAKSVALACDKELTNLKETMKRCEQMFYNMGFTDVVNSCNTVIFEALRHRFFEGWIVAVNALNLPKSSPFKDPTQIPLPNDLLVQAPTNE